MITKVKKQVSNLLKNDPSGHGMDHIERVLDLSLTLAKEEANVNLEVISLIALLHDVDDYKLFGSESAKHLTNVTHILNTLNIEPAVASQVLEGIRTIGFNKRLEGIIPTSIEAKIVSDADMCDALGVTGILRTYAYSLQKGATFFDPSQMPRLILSAEEYRNHSSKSSVHHLFEKILKLKDFMLTTAAKKEAAIRHQAVVQFLSHYFREQNAPEWFELLNKTSTND